MYLYSTGPIDHFGPLLSVEAFDERGVGEPVREFIERCLRDLAEETAFDPEEIAAGPWVSALPDGGGGNYPALVVMVKASTNGTVYVASPVELPHLSEYWTATLDKPRHPAWKGDGRDW